MILASRVSAVCALLFVIIAMTYLPIPAAQAGEGRFEGSSVVETYVTAGGMGGFLILLTGLALIVLIPIGALKARKEMAWPHWWALVRGLGEAALLLGVTSAFSGMISAFRTISIMGATVTPSDLADGLSRAAAPIHSGAIVALLALLGGGLIRALSPVDSPS